VSLFGANSGHGGDGRLRLSAARSDQWPDGSTTLGCSARLRPSAGVRHDTAASAALPAAAVVYGRWSRLASRWVDSKCRRRLVRRASGRAPRCQRWQSVQRCVSGAAVMWPTTVCLGVCQRHRSGVDDRERHGGWAGGTGRFYHTTVTIRLEIHPFLEWC
jgi:hypothetical protein